MTTFKRVFSAVVAILLVLLLYGAVIEPRLFLDTEEVVAPIPDLPEEWDRQVVAAVADFQIGMWWANRGMMERALEEIIERRPAAVLLVGDFIYHPGEKLPQLVQEVEELLQPLAAARIPTFAVLGNHDWAVNVRNGTINPEAAREVSDALAGLGIEVLNNRTVTLQRSAGRQPLYLVGIGSAWADDDRVSVALEGVPAGAARVVFMHNPDTFAEIPAGAAPLGVAAHTHGGQIRVPSMPEWSWMALLQNERVHADGWIDGYGAPGNRLYVNRGIGFSTIPMRIFCPPEVTFFTLRRAPS
ncbi:MAG: metallophosphoesterase [Gemmatimonadetes bacterium]|nr:metallophosphoesterase [Gemmatimonadota bacterium]